MRPANATENFDQLLDDQTDLAIYGHVHKQLLRYGSQGQQILNPGTIGMPYFDWEPIQNHRAQYALIDVEEDGVTNLQFRKVAYDYEAELQDAKDQGLPFIEMYEELRREDNYRGHNIELLTSLIEKYGYAILGCKTLQALSFCVKIGVTEIEKEEAYEISRAQIKNAMRSSISLTNRSIQRMYGQLLKLRPWHQVRIIANLGNLWSFVKKMQNWQN